MQTAAAKQHWRTDPHSCLGMSSLIKNFGTKGQIAKDQISEPQS